ncbi:AaceriADR005Wp [[Ashbya] aceris (nom. inval.)]|nr:AaceriADR005Wp [[Ashbya] aceris (nom. inval.)]
MNALVVGATGLCGAAILKHAAESTSFNKVYALVRRQIPNAAARVETIVNEQSDSWPESIPAGVDVFFSGLGTTRANAGGLENQYKVDHDLNIAVAKAAKERGCRVCVIVSAIGASVNARLPYNKLKGDIERDLLALDFERTVILRPGVLLGERETHHKGFGNSVAVFLGKLVYRGRFQALLGYPVYGDEVGQVAVALALSDDKSKVRIVESAEILSLVKQENTQ